MCLVKYMMQLVTQYIMMNTHESSTVNNILSESTLNSYTLHTELSLLIDDKIDVEAANKAALIAPIDTEPPMGGI